MWICARRRISPAREALVEVLPQWRIRYGGALLPLTVAKWCTPCRPLFLSVLYIFSSTPTTAWMSPLKSNCVRE